MPLMEVKADEDKTYVGAFVAAPTVPWGTSVSADTGTGTSGAYGYRAVWTRDEYEMATALLAAGGSGSGPVCPGGDGPVWLGGDGNPGRTVGRARGPDRRLGAAVWVLDHQPQRDHGRGQEEHGREWNIEPEPAHGQPPWDSFL